jgi:hypothetical protein
MFGLLGYTYWSEQTILKWDHRNVQFGEFNEC